ncbi:MAG: 1-deoxy-D-xylulose-5-phosphate reductoisomerase [Acidimicrobiaceae bacterium]|nr:1-deoxy-D-xylulose-5-phosphate reductoisomerase [Acidimicrobiaceae bacterium]MCY4175587.1 1-deoxy-D-xylulose-5-phosphate reductoisomerase [Acidimicrobiaceae bacterium]MCY4280814.1 1-deoxy-D-xylulose-5-phosphate reductoisomerase [Acidimicrobiaceae bacterium]MCY4295010.1 1-deoxy-D-xylulose-5-phosphate reductoisomerase [Acidimicrobiaceae bacterium]
MTTSVALLGATGSIGTQTLDIVAAKPDSYRIAALGAANSVDLLAEQTRRFRPDVVAIANADRAAELAEQIPDSVELLAGEDAMADAVSAADTVVNAVVGFAGLPVTLAALESGKRLGLANKESLIAAGPVVQRVRGQGTMIPVDSEHCAIHQCLRAVDSPEQVAEIVLTASGGPFRGRSSADLAQVGVADALAHPTWRMGPKITVDSSTLMNKGLEVIEAHELFGVDYDRIEVVVHPQSIVHSMVTFCDAATLAQLSKPDMRLCIGYALAYPDRLDHPYGAIDWAQLGRLDFEPPDRQAFGCLDLAYQAGRAGRTAPAWLNAANEVAVQAFLDERIRWADIASVLDAALQQWPGAEASDVAAVLAADAEARRVAESLVSGASGAAVDS